LNGQCPLALWAQCPSGAQHAARTGAPLLQEWGQFGIRCNALAFGLIDTRLTRAKEGGETVQVWGGTCQVRQSRSWLVEGYIAASTERPRWPSAYGHAAPRTVRATSTTNTDGARERTTSTPNTGGAREQATSTTDTDDARERARGARCRGLRARPRACKHSAVSCFPLPPLSPQQPQTRLAVGGSVLSHRASVSNKQGQLN